MKEFFKQFSGMIGASIAAACCLGLPVILSALGAVGLGFIIHDAYLFPLFVGFASLSLWLLRKSSLKHGSLKPFLLSLIGGLIGAIALWLMVTGIYPIPWLVYTGLVLLFAGSVWDFIIGRNSSQTCDTSPVNRETVNTTRRIALGAGAAVAFYGMYKSVDLLVPEAQDDEIACWGINECKGKTACTTAFNACTSQNECRGRGYIYVPAKECNSRGGEPLKGSKGDPAKSS